MSMWSEVVTASSYREALSADGNNLRVVPFASAPFRNGSILARGGADEGQGDRPGRGGTQHVCA